MKYFYYVRHGGVIWPQASADHPSSRLDKPRNIVGAVIDLKPEERDLSLSELMKKYPCEVQK